MISAGGAERGISGAAEDVLARLKGKELQEQIARLVEPMLVHEGYELVEVEVVGTGPRTILRLFIDKPGGVSIDDCAHVSEGVDAVLDVEDPFESSYTLEVSSPGLDRPLRKKADFEKYAGRKVRVKTYGPVPGAGDRKMFPGTLIGLEGESVRVLVDGVEFKVPLDAIAKANLDWEPNE
jgi:ribosome maturation factor RimP